MDADAEEAYEQALEAGIPISAHHQKKIDERPQLMEGLGLYYKAFQRLGSCRSYGMACGPIPWTAIEQYADAQGFDAEHRDCLHYHIELLDNTYLRHVNKPAKGK